VLCTKLAECAAHLAARSWDAHWDGWCLQMSNFAESGQAADLLTTGCGLPNVDVLLLSTASLPLNRLLQSSHSTVPPQAVATAALFFEDPSAENSFLPWEQENAGFLAAAWCLGSSPLANPFSARMEEAVSCARKRADVLPDREETETDWKPSLTDNTSVFAHNLDKSGDVWLSAPGKPSHSFSNGNNEAHFPVSLLCGFSYA